MSLGGRGKASTSALILALRSSGRSMRPASLGRMRGGEEDEKMSSGRLRPGVLCLMRRIKNLDLALSAISSC